MDLQASLVVHRGLDYSVNGLYGILNEFIPVKLVVKRGSLGNQSVPGDSKEVCNLIVGELNQHARRAFENFGKHLNAGWLLERHLFPYESIAICSELEVSLSSNVLDREAIRVLEKNFLPLFSEGLVIGVGSCILIDYLVGNDVELFARVERIHSSFGDESDKMYRIEKESKFRVVSLSNFAINIFCPIKINVPGLVSISNELARLILEDCQSGIMLTGTPGSGKTYLIQEVCRQLGLDLIKIRPVDLEQSRIQGSAESFLLGIRDQIISRHGILSRNFNGVVLFFDDLDGLQSLSITTLLCKILDDYFETYRDQSKFAIVAATSRFQDIPKALLRSCRFDRLLEIPSLTFNDRRELIEQLTRNMPSPHSLLETDIDVIARKTIGFNAAMLVRLLKELFREDVMKSNISLERLLQDIPSSGSQVSHIQKVLKDFYGIEDIISMLNSYIMLPLQNPLKYEELGVPLPKGLLLHGPAGCGKSSLALAFAHHLREHALIASYRILEPTEIISKVVGSSENSLRSVFQECREMAPCVLIIDQMESIAPRRRQESHSISASSDRLLSTLLMEIDGLASNSSSMSKQIIILGTTRDPSALDPAILRPGRLDFLVEMNLLSENGRISMLESLLPKEMPKEEIVFLAKETEGFSAAQLENLWRESALSALSRDINNGIDQVSTMDLRNSLSKLKPS